MRIDINKKYCITSDARNYIVNEKRVTGDIDIHGQLAKNAGAEYLEAIAYFGNLNQCFRYLTDRQIRESDCTSLGEIKVLLKQIQSELDTAVNL